MSVKSKILYFVLAPVAAMSIVAVTGCKAVREARNAQAAVASSMNEDEAAKRKFEQVKIASTSLESLVAYAMTNRPAMRSAELAVNDARLQLKAIAADAPIVSRTPWNAFHLGSSMGYSEKSSSAHFSGFDHSTSRSNPSGDISVDLLLYDFGRNAARAKAASENVIAAEVSLIDEGYRVFNDVSGAYFTLLCNEALSEVAVSNVAQFATRLSQANDMFEQGEAQHLDVLKARLDLASAIEAAVQVSNDVAVAGANLVAYLGINAAQGEYTKVFGSQLGGLHRVMRGFPDTAEAADKLFASARINAPALKVARARLRAASSNVDYAVANMKPEFRANFLLNWTDPLWYWRWGVSASQSIFTGWGKTTALERAVVEMKKCESDIEAAELLLSRNLEVAIAERDNAREAEKTAYESLLKAKENLDTVIAQYDVGDVSRIEYTDAVSSYTQALGNRIKAFYRGQMAEAALFGLLGVQPLYDEGSVAFLEKQK